MPEKEVPQIQKKLALLAQDATRDAVRSNSSLTPIVAEQSDHDAADPAAPSNSSRGFKCGIDVARTCRELFEQRIGTAREFGGITVDTFAGFAPLEVARLCRSAAGTGFGMWIVRLRGR